MGIKVASEAQYENSVRSLFPQGEYWDAQFADQQSDASLFIKAKADEIIKFRQRMSVLLDESKMETTNELIDDWERIYLDAVFPDLDINQRRLQLKSKNDSKLNRVELQKIAAIFGLDIKDVNFPYRPRFFGFAKFAQERLGSFSTFSVIKITVTETGFNTKYCEAIKIELEHHRFTKMYFGIKRLGYFPVNKMREIVYRKLRNGCFGYGRFAKNMLTPFPINEVRQTALSRLDTKRFTRLFFGQSRITFFAGYFAKTLVLDQNYFGTYITYILQMANFYKRLERALIDAYLTCASPYYEFEMAIRKELLANHIPIFYYKGE